MRCILEVDSPSYPPTIDEYQQCGCSLCLGELRRQAMDETVDERISRLEELGLIDPSCKTCQAEFYPAIKEGRIAYGPRHMASKRCESGKRPHCTCDICF